MSESMIERVAKALAAAEDKNWDGEHSYMEELARVAIAAMHEHTAENRRIRVAQAKSLMAAMIDAALTSSIREVG